MENVNRVLRESCKTPMLTYLLSAIFIINIFITFYAMYNEYSLNNNINFKTHAPILLYYIIILGITMKFHCNPTTSLMYHPFIFIVVFGYVLTIGIGGLINLYFLLPTGKELGAIIDTGAAVKVDNTAANMNL